MTKWIFDIEADGLLKEATTAWVIVAYNLVTKEYKHWLWDDLGWKETFNQATMLIGHNICGYDLPLLHKLHGWRPPKTCKVIDTLIWSLVLDYRRFGDRGHSLEVWGEALGFPKTEFNDFHQYSTKMLEYCTNDVRLSHLVFDYLKEEYNTAIAKKAVIAQYIKAEKAVARWCAEAELHGWPFNVDAARKLYADLEAEMKKAEDALTSKLGYKTVAVDKKKGEVEPKRPKWTKQGFYDSRTAEWFGVHPCCGYEGEERPIEGEYSRIAVEPLSLSSVADVKIFLFRNGWVPTEWNYKKDDEGKRTKEKSTPKITEDSLEFLGGDGKLYVDYLTASSRHSILKTWLENVDSEGNLHGECFPIGTPSMRARHKIIVNVPSVDSAWGPEMRKLFIAKPGWKLIGCDSSGNQARVLAWYLNDSNFINTLLHGDIHQYNADTLTRVLNTMGIQHTVKRGQAKRIFYAFLFGASGAKLWSYIFGNLDHEQGTRLKKGFLKEVPGFEKLIKTLENLYGASKKYSDGYIPSIAGSRIYVDSFHKLLVYLLQAGEKITCSAALMLTAERLEEEGIPYLPCIFMHDEIDLQVPEEYADRAAAVGKSAFADGPKLFGIDIMSGDAKIGDSWYDVH